MRNPATHLAFLILSLLNIAFASVSREFPNRVVSIAGPHGNLAYWTSILLKAGIIEEVTEQTRSSKPCRLTRSPRVSTMEEWRKIQEARVETYNWIAGDTILIQTGDMVDGGIDTIAVYALLRRLQQQAKEAGGEVIPLLGNHETMNVCGHGQFDDKELATFDDPPHWKAYINREEAFSETGFIGSELRTWDSVVVVGGTLYSHAGLGIDFTEQSVADLNQKIRKSMNFKNEEEKKKACNSPNSVLQHVRGPQYYAETQVFNDITLDCKYVKQVLHNLEAERMVIGHNSRLDGWIRSNCQDKMFVIDVESRELESKNAAALEMSYEYYGNKLANVKISGVYAGREPPVPESRLLSYGEQPARHFQAWNGLLTQRQRHSISV